MNDRKRLLGVTCFLLIVSCYLFSWISRQAAAPMPEPSAMGGYYDEAFVLKLSAPENGSIYYTTDGSMPTTASAKYQGGIPIQNRSSESNRYASIQNIIADWKTYTPDPAPVEKGTVIRAMFVNNLGIQSDVFTQTYFVGIDPPERGYTLSLIFEQDDLFGDNGIYVTGKEYDTWYLSGDAGAQKPTPNFEKDLEVPAIAELLDSHGDVMNQAIGLRIQGASARGELQKRFTLVSRAQYSGSDVFETNLYEGVTTHSVMLKSYVPDAIASDLLADRAVSTQASIPVRVYLNGEYWYDSFMLERYDTNYFRQHYQIDNRVLVKNGVMDEDSAANTDLDFYGEFMYWVKNTDFSDPEQWEQFCVEADVQSHIDYLIANYFLCNIDFSDEHNYVLWRSPSPGSDAYADMRWRWCMYDIDALAWVTNYPSYGSPETINVFSNDFAMDIQDTSIYRALRNNPQYCQQFVLSFMDMLNNNFSPVATEAVLETYGLSPEWTNGYFRKRPAYAVQHLAGEFDLSGSLETVTVISENPEMGNVIVNSSQIDLSCGTWSGQYFTDYPITVTAIANDRYQFLGWKGDADQAGPTLTLPVDGGVTLEAVFAKIK